MVKFYRKHYSYALKCMRITTLLFGIQACFATMLLASNLNAQNISLDVQKTDVKQIFIAIEKQANVSFVYDGQALQGLPVISIKEKSKSLDEVLQSISSKLPLVFKQAGKVIGVSRSIAGVKNGKGEVVPENKAQTIKISGRIYNHKNEPIEGVTVTVKDSKTSASSNENGMYSINADVEQTLVFKSIGYVSKEVAIAGRSQIDVVLEESLSTLDEVHVIAYGTTSERLTTGSISKINSSTIEQQPVGNPLAALDGEIAGLVVTQSSGVPGAGFKIQIRGQNSIAQGSDPFFIIDGVPFAPGNTPINMLASAVSSNSLNNSSSGISPFNSLNPADIESIEVLKDADATAIYGSRGANGVVLITTKKGKAGKTQVDFNLNSGISMVPKMLNMLNTQQYLQMRHEAFANDGVTPTTSTAPDLLVYDTTRYTNIEKMLIGGTAHMDDVTGSISGGNTNTQFIMSGTYHRETTVFPGDNADNRGAFHFSLNHASQDKKFSVSLSAIYSSDNDNIVSTDLTSFINLPPDAPAFKDASGNLIWSYNGLAIDENPIAYELQRYTAQTDNLSSNLVLSYKLLPGLTVKSSFGYNTISINEVSISPQSSVNPQSGTLGSSSFGNNATNSWIIEPQAEYLRQIGKGKLDVLAGGTWQSNVNNATTTFASGYTSDNLLQSLSAAGDITAQNYYTLYHYEAQFARINYNWQDKYIINLTGRRDGSSRFGPGNQFADFGAAGAAWLFSNENFISDNLPFLSYGKLRGSYGITGNDQIGDYKYLDSYSTLPKNPYQGIAGLYLTQLSNPTFGWEINRKLDVEIDLGFLKDRILFTADYYRNRSSNQLITYNLPIQTGFYGIEENFPAVVQNKGIEFTLNTKNITSASFSWNTSLNLSIPKNTLLSFPNIQNSSYYQTLVVGQPLDVIYKYHMTGVNPQTGVYQYQDVNNDGNLDANDYKLEGNLDPKFYGGFRNTFNYKNFQLDFFFDFRKQLGLNYLNSIYNYPPGNAANYPTYILGAWQAAGQSASVQKYTTMPGSDAYNAASNLYLSDAIYSDASFIRLKNLSFSYRLPISVMNKWKLSNLRVYVEGQNLFTITDYKGFDPETQNLYSLPPLRTIVFGIQLTL